MAHKPQAVCAGVTQEKGCVSPVALYKAKHTQLPAHRSLRLKGEALSAPHLLRPAHRDVRAQLGEEAVRSGALASLPAPGVDTLVYVAPPPHFQAWPPRTRNRGCSDDISREYRGEDLTDHP